MKILPFLLFIIGAYLIIVYITNISCPPKKIEYRYLPRDQDSDVQDPVMMQMNYGNLYRCASPYNRNAVVFGNFTTATTSPSNGN